MSTDKEKQKTKKTNQHRRERLKKKKMRKDRKLGGQRTGCQSGESRGGMNIMKTFYMKPSKNKKLKEIWKNCSFGVHITH